MSIRTNIYLDDAAVWLKFRVLCLQSGTSASREIRRLIEARVHELEAQSAAQQKGAAVTVKKPAATRTKNGAREARG